jgi:glycerophosphoryl diester phosphodiesterase
LLTKDKVPIITHNDDLSILTHYRGYAHTTPFATVRSLDVGSHFSAAYSGVTMPTLVEALEIIGTHKVLTIVEIKSQPDMAASAAELVGGILSDVRMRGPMMVSSSSLRIIHELKRRHPAIPRAFILKRKAFSFFLTALFARFEGVSAIHPSLLALTPALVERMRRRGGQIQAWTANEREDFDQCLALDVDGIITDDVVFAHRYLDEFFGTARRRYGR